MSKHKYIAILAQIEKVLATFVNTKEVEEKRLLPGAQCDGCTLYFELDEVVTVVKSNFGNVLICTHCANSYGLEIVE